MIASTQTNHPLAQINSSIRPDAPLEQAFALLRKAGLRITQPRIAILTALISSEQPTSIEQLHGDLADGSCDLVTVYRCLAAFEEIGIVRRSFFHNGTSLYEINLSGANRYHIVSKNTREVRTLDPESTAELSATVERIENRLRSLGYTDVSHVVEFFAESKAHTRAQLPITADES
ncbi:MAG: transcriptional repressor [Cephaloticoccus sp.]|nr:transcriptional repressor [Cephaloticoccus sp.]MCF7760374.1 transcriptional repressor [Cephaloticoccus sp.]